MLPLLLLLSLLSKVGDCSIALSVCHFLQHTQTIELWLSRNLMIGIGHTMQEVKSKTLVLLSVIGRRGSVAQGIARGGK